MDLIPLELVEQILRHAPSMLNPSDLSSTLRNLCLVSHTWKQIAQPLLFSKFIRYGCSYNQIKLHQTLLSYPHLLDLVGCIWVNIGNISTHVYTTGSGSVLKSVLDLYHNLTRNSHFHHIVIKDLHDPRTGEVLSSLISSTNITVLSCHRLWEYPLELFYHCSSVRELHIHHSSFSGFERVGDGNLGGNGRLDDNRIGLGTRPTLSSNRRPHLLHLYLESSQGDDDILLKWFLHPNCAFDISQLKTFDFQDESCQRGSFQTVQDLITHTSSSLEEVGLHPPVYLTEEIIDPEYPIFASLPRLRYLKISLYEDENLWPWVIQLLSSLSHPEHLEELQLSYTLAPSEPAVAPLREDQAQAQGWKELDLCLTTHPSLASTDDNPTAHQKFLNLKAVRIGLVVCEWTQNGEIRSRQLAEEFPVILPTLSALTLVKVSFPNISGFIHNSDCWYFE